MQNLNFFLSLSQDGHLSNCLSKLVFVPGKQI